MMKENPADDLAPVYAATYDPALRSRRAQGDKIEWAHDRVAGQAMLSALYTRGGRLYTRTYEHAGQPAQVAVEWIGRPADLQAVTLREQPLGRLGRRAHLTPWQVQTLKINPA